MEGRHPRRGGTKNVAAVVSVEDIAKFFAVLML